MSLAERKSAFLDVLSANLDKSVQGEIMAFWEEKYSDKPQFGVSAFLDELYTNYDINIKKGQLFKELSRATTRAGFNTNRNANNVDSATGSDLNAPVSEAGLMVFETLHNGFLQLLTDVEKSRIRELQCNGIKKQPGVRPEEVSSVSAWLNHGKHLQGKAISLATLKKVFNLAYVECCQLHGPVKADKMLNSAMGKANELSESLLAPPVQFI